MTQSHGSFNLSRISRNCDSKRFAQNLFALIRAKARTVAGLHHSPKDFQKAQQMTLENILRGSGDIGAMLATCWGILQIDHATTQIYVQNTKLRDFVPCAPFVITGRPSIDEMGHFTMTTQPGMAESFAGIRQRMNGKEPGRPKTEGSKVNAALRLRNEGAKVDAIAEALEVNRATVFRWFKAAGAATECDGGG
jgi:Homeodomain-like domain